MRTVVIMAGAWIGFCVFVLAALLVSMWVGPKVDRFLSGDRVSSLEICERIERLGTWEPTWRELS